MPTLLIPGVQIQVKLDRSKSEFHLLNTKNDAKAVFKFNDATLYVRHVKPNASILIAHTQALRKANARYDVRKVALKSSRSIREVKACPFTMPYFVHYLNDYCSV